MKSYRQRSSEEGYCIQVLIINDEIQDNLSKKSFHIENIGNGGFRFISEVKFKLEDRIEVLLRFPDDYSQKVVGRICYCDEIDNERTAYGFSIIDGFYSLHASVA